LVKLTKILSGEEFRILTDDAVARGFWSNDPRVFKPGMAWYCPWVYDPTGEWTKAGKHQMIAEERKGEIGYLSQFYWRDWSDKRPPITVVCPNGETWEIDRKSKDGDGWTVTGEFPDLSCNPSIVVEGYHGYLIGGIFSKDLEGRGQNGKARPITNRKPGE
jgi:hypothetical protein